MASDIPGTNEAVLDGETGFLVRINNISELANKIVFLLQDDGVRRTMGRRAQDYARKNFSSEAAVKKRIDLYQEILGR